MRSLDHHFIGRQGELSFDQSVGFRLTVIKPTEQNFGIRLLEIVGGHLYLILMVDIAIGHHLPRMTRPNQLENRIDALQVHGTAFKAIGDFARNRSAI